MSQNAAAKYLGVSAPMLMRLRKNGRLSFVRLSPTCIRYRKADLDSFMENCYVAAKEKTA